MQKNSMLTIVSIVLIVFAVFSLIFAFSFSMFTEIVTDAMKEAIESGDMTLEGISEEEFFEWVSLILNYISVAMFVSAAILFVAGVAGIVQKSVPLCWVLGVLCVLISLVPGVLYLVGTKKFQDERQEFFEQQQNDRYF